MNTGEWPLPNDLERGIRRAPPAAFAYRATLPMITVAACVAGD